MSKPATGSAEGPANAIADVPERERYELRLDHGDGPLAAFLDYRRSDRWIALLHTEVLEAYEGQGLGSQLAGWVFEDARQRGLSIIPKCPFIVRWLERHPEQHDVLLHPLDVPPPRGPRTPLESA